MSTENFNSDVEDNATNVEALVLDNKIEETSLELDLEPEIVEPTISEVKDDSVITAEKPVETKPSMTNIANGVIGTGATEVKPKAKKSDAKDDLEKVALFSEKNIYWEGVGRINKGYNIVDAEAAKKWLKRTFIRLATPEEIKQEFGK